MQIILIGANNPETGRIIKAVKSNNPDISFQGFLDNDPAKKGKVYVNLPILGGFELLSNLVKDNLFLNLITSDCKTRFETSLEVAQAGGKFTNLIHPSVNLDDVRTGKGNYIQENVVLQAGVKVGNNSSIHIGTLVGHETEIGHSVFIAHGCNLSGCINIKDGVFMGTGVSIVPRVSIGKWSILGAGTVITKDIPPYSVVVGNPGKVISQVEYKGNSGDIVQQMTKETL